MHAIQKFLQCRREVTSTDVVIPKQNVSNRIVLPQEIVSIIFSSLDFENLRIAAQVCKNWSIVSKHDKLGLKMYLQMIRCLLPDIELKKIDRQRSYNYLNISTLLNWKELNEYCDTFSLQKKILFDYNSQYFLKAIKNSEDCSLFENQELKNLEISGGHLCRLILKKTKKYSLLKFLSLFSEDKPHTTRLYSVSIVFTGIMIQKDHPHINELQKKVIIEAEATMNAFIQNIVNKKKYLSDQPNLIEQLKSDAYYGY